MNAKKISALLLAAAMMVPCAAPAQTVLAEEAGATEMPLPEAAPVE